MEGGQRICGRRPRESRSGLLQLDEEEREGRGEEGKGEEGDDWAGQERRGEEGVVELEAAHAGPCRERAPSNEGRRGRWRAHGEEALAMASRSWARLTACTPRLTREGRCERDPRGSRRVATPRLTGGGWPTRVARSPSKDGSRGKLRTG